MSKEEEYEDRGDVFITEEEDDEVEELDSLDEDEDDESNDDDQDDTDDSMDDDDESEDDDDDESEDESEDEDDEDSEQRIPKGRLNQVLRQRDEERERVRWLEDQLEVLIRGRNDGVTAGDEEEEEDITPPEYDFDESEAKYIELILEGEVKDATALRKEINRARDELYNYQIETARKSAKNDAVTETSNSLDEARFNTMLQGYVEEFDFLNDQSKAYNEKAVVMANNLMASYMAKGKTKSQALKSAVEDVTPFFEKKKAENTSTSDRTKTARKKAARASKAQPPVVKGKGKTTRELKPSDITSEKVFNSLTAKEKAKLRGDFVA